MHRILFVLAAVGLASITLTNMVDGQTQSSSLTVTASVTKNCTISTTPVNFGAYDPVAANATAPLDGIGTIVVACTKGATAKVWLNTGSNNAGSTRRMAQGGVFLNYELYKDAGRAQIWGNTDATGLNISAATNRNPRTFTTYGRVPAAQDATVGNYTDTVVATVNF